MGESLQLTQQQARRLAVVGALLSAPRPVSVHDAVARLGRLQLDPTAAVARAERLVLFSRLGSYDSAELDRELWSKRRLFEYWAFVVPVDDFAIHRETMLRFPWGHTRGSYVKKWMDANASFRRYVMSRVRSDGPLLSRQLEDRGVLPWRTGGWNEGKNLSRMLEILWAKGDITTAGREGNERLWDLAERRLPMRTKRIPPDEVARRILDAQLRVRGIARKNQFGRAFDGRPPAWEQALRELVDGGIAIPATVQRVRGSWYVHKDVLGRPFKPRTTVLAPFDPLINERNRTEDLFGFRYRLEIYVPKDKREYGYYVLPILSGDRLIGRVDPFFDRESRRLVLHSVHAEPGENSGKDAARAVAGLAKWLGATGIDVPRNVPTAWRKTFAALG